MKKKIGLIALVGCLGLSLTGCKGETDDVNKQLEKMSDVIEEGELFDDDYQIKAEMKLTDDGKTSTMKYHFEKDKEKYWIKIEIDDGNEEKYIESWVGEKDDKFYAFYDNNGKDKIYAEIDSEDVDEAIGEAMDGVEGMETNLKDLYDAAYGALKAMVETCNSNQSDKITCSVDKSLFGKVTLTLESDAIFGEGKMTTSYSLKGGKLRETTIKSDEAEVTMKLGYGNQIVRLPDTDDFKKAGE